MSAVPPPPPPEPGPLRLGPVATLLVRLGGSGLAGYVVGPLVAGMVWCVDCDTLLERLFIGVVHVFLSVFTLGFPPRNEAAVGPPRNAWPYIGVVALAVLLAWTLAAWLARRRRQSGSSGP